MVHSYIGRLVSLCSFASMDLFSAIVSVFNCFATFACSHKLEDAVSLEDAVKIDSMKTMSMFDFEDWMWSKFGCQYCQHSDRSMVLNPFPVFSYWK